MKAIFVAYDLAHHENILEALKTNMCRGFTAFGEVQGRGSVNGEPHLGTHAWPSLASALITFVDDDRVDALLNSLHAIDMEKPKLGLRAFVWDVEKTI